MVVIIFKISIRDHGQEIVERLIIINEELAFQNQEKEDTAGYLLPIRTSFPK
jgi:hypothetical protein